MLRLIRWLLPVTVCCSVFGISAGYAQDTIVVDLAMTNATDTVSTGRYAIRVINRLPKGNYVVGISRGSQPIAPIRATSVQSDDCEALVGAIDALEEATSEEQVPALLERLESALAASTDDESCTDQNRARAERVRESTRWTHPTNYALGDAEYLRVNVQRLAANNRAARTWQKTVVSEPDGGWKVSYGYGIPLLTVGPTYRSYATEAVGTRFVVTGDKNRHELDLVPSVFFTYAGGDERGFRWNKLTAGLGLDLREPVLMLGTGVTYYGNLSVSAGGSVRRESVLRSAYHVGDTLTGAIQNDQLLESAYRFRPYVSLTVRFDRNPFSKPQEQPKEAKPATGETETPRPNPETGAAEPTDPPAEETPEPTDPPTEPTEPTNPPAEPTNPPAEPADPPAEPTQPSTEPAEPTEEGEEP